MNEKINIAELLKDCPKGMELYSPLCGECRVLNIYDGLGFDVICGDDTVYNFSYDGRYNIMGECCIFPSKENRDWSKFQRPFKDGDVVFYNDSISIFKEWRDETLFRTHCVFYTNVSKMYSFEVDRPLFGKSVRREIRFATYDEKAKLFQAIKENGYHWNPETKTLEKVVPKFKVGDRVKKNKDCISGIVTDILNDSFKVTYYGGGCSYVQFHYQDDCELVPNHKFNVGDRITFKYYDRKVAKIIEISNDGYKLDNGKTIQFQDENAYEISNEKFDISDLKPFESRVLVRDYDYEYWRVSFFGYCDKFMGKFDTVRGVYIQCIPYEDNEHLLGTTNDCKDFYKNW